MVETAGSPPLRACKDHKIQIPLRTRQTSAKTTLAALSRQYPVTKTDTELL